MARKDVAIAWYCNEESLFISSSVKFNQPFRSILASALEYGRYVILAQRYSSKIISHSNSSGIKANEEEAGFS